ncbi:MAG: CpaF family protein [Fimbriiglobus sp.]|jgi:Flp pilus assembly CpaF family ATPase|nr:CpaF family protein [Fimbriiglobus sp.]
MRFEVIDGKLSRHSASVPVTRGMNAVLIGNSRECHVRLKSSGVGEVAAGLAMDQDGWWFYNLSRSNPPLEMTVGPVHERLDDREKGRPPVAECVLWQADTRVLVATPRLKVRVDRFEITVAFEADEFDAQRADEDRQDRQMTTLVREVHTALLNELVTPNSDPKEKYRDEYILQLEKRIEGVASGRRDFPNTDLTQTALGDHMAGVAVRSELIRQLIADSGESERRARGSDPSDAQWVRMRSGLHAQEDELKGLVGRAKDDLARHLAAEGAEDAADLSARMKGVAARFWAFWKELLAGPHAPGSTTRRYLALRRLKEEIKDYWYGFGPLEDLLDDPTVTEIMVVDRDHVFVETGGQIELSGRRFLTDPQTVIEKIVNDGDRELNTSQPVVNVRMPNGSRANAVDRCLALRGSCLTIRRFPKARLSIDALIANGSLTPAVAAFLKAAVVNRRNVLVSGGTGSGKTTLLNALSQFIPDKERIITVEDTAELQLHKAHVVTLQARPANTQREGEVSIRELVKNSLRMRPDRIVVGECRGAEALDMLQAMNTGHDGSLTTLHANSPDDVIQRLETMCQMANKELPVESVHRMTASAVDLIVQLTAVTVTHRRPDGSVARKRRKVVSEVAEVEGLSADGRVQVKPLFARTPADGPLRPTGRLPTFLPDMIAAGLVDSPLPFLADPPPNPAPAR